LSARFFLLAKYLRVDRQRDELAAGLRAFPAGEYVVLCRPVGEDALILRVVRGSRDLEALFRE
jgi:toxin ParE1/3/4